MKTILEKITDTKKDELTRIVLPASRMTDAPKRSLTEAIRHSDWPVGVIAEVKKASPSRGVISQDFDPEQIAKAYEQAGANGISILTDEQYFQGHSEYLTRIKQTSSVPLLRKDFIIDSLQVKESERMGADAILLIAAILEPSALQEYYDEAVELGMDVLVEVHNQKETEDVLSVVTPALLGVNNRDLHTFHTDLAVTEQLAHLIPDESMLISESGIRTNADIKRIQKAGSKGILAGESFMLAEDKTRFINELMNGEVTS
ncbi:Indole-3-glycerol-phosphate synthase [[Bacillus] selenitireducens MLS10]|uniref:Indole-3-glycerol phosphate synthase n=1 Tax=Bacillus selenitireducens (strain ATCC 700615 / DSM 15326 / MLS10) TaxID=439292 RepID=D6XUZ2_BACIE|nr:indole-3-glycerol phosphate synthase TrpC [Salisediminibacterium selenitireducens]ADH99628.1 Indole-3-glycerol-phosphate synthase [[Bacillus] selenitireducens MLS10]